MNHDSIFFFFHMLSSPFLKCWFRLSSAPMTKEFDQIVGAQNILFQYKYTRPSNNSIQVGLFPGWLYCKLVGKSKCFYGSMVSIFLRNGLYFGSGSPSHHRNGPTGQTRTKKSGACLVGRRKKKGGFVTVNSKNKSILFKIKLIS